MVSRSAASRARPKPRTSTPPSTSGLPYVVVALLALHVTLAFWGAARNSVTFDENFHVPAGVAIVTRGDFSVSPVNPPLVKALQGAAALAAGARVPGTPDWTRSGHYEAGAAFQRVNVDRYHRVFFAARAVTVILSVMLALVLFWFGRALFGPWAGVLAVALYAVTPEAIAHAGFATMDTATALAWLAAVAACWRFVRRPSRLNWGLLAGAFAFGILTRFTALALLPVLTVLAIVLTRPDPAARRRVLGGIALLIPVTILALWVGYLGQVSFQPLQAFEFRSDTFASIAQAMPWLRLPLPDSWLIGLDHQAFEGQSGLTPTYLLGRISTQAEPFYFPIAIGLKWPIGLLVAGLAGATFGRAGAGRTWRDDGFTWLPPLVLLVAGMTVVQLNAGVRYMLPVLPFVCLAGARLVSDGAGHVRWRTAAGWACVVVVAWRTATAAPWFLTSFNELAGPVSSHERLLNDSNLDWGQGLIALREAMRERGIERVHLAYHGTTDPATYGIDYVPYRGGMPGPQSEWLAVSSYFRVGLAQRMVTPEGRTDFVHFDMRALDTLEPAARPARCMALYRIR